MKLAPEAITDIVLTHCHFDHMGSIAEFPNAHIHIQKSELCPGTKPSRSRDASLT